MATDTATVSGCLTERALEVYLAVRDSQTEADTGMSNFDHSVDEGADEALQRGEYILHAAYEFNGLVVLRDGIYVEWVRRYGSVVCRHTAGSLRALMQDVNDSHGWGLTRSSR